MKKFTSLLAAFCLLALMAVPAVACDYGLPRSSSVRIYTPTAAAAPMATPTCPAPEAPAEVPAAGTVYRQVERALEAPARTVEVQRVVTVAPAYSTVYVERAQAPVIYRAQRSFAAVDYYQRSRSAVFIQRAPRAKVFVQQAPVVKVQRQREVIIQRGPAVRVQAPARDVTVIQRRGLFGAQITKVKTR